MKTTLIIIGVIALLVLALVWFMKQKIRTLSDVKSSDNILVLSDNNFAQKLKGKTVLVDFWAEWCMPCKMMLPILNDLSADLPKGYHVAKLDVDKHQRTAQKYAVKSIPTLILFRNGKEIDRFVGVKSKAYLKKQML